MSVLALELATANDIILICLPSHTTHYLQPLDRSFFRSLKHYFKEACNSWMINHYRPNNPHSEVDNLRKIGRLQFGELLFKAWGQAATPQNAISGFKATGVVPLDRTAIPDFAFITDQNSEELQQQNDVDPLEGTSTAYPNVLENKSLEDEQQEQQQHQQQQAIETPKKLLNKISPIPKMGKPKANNKRKQVAANLTTAAFINQRKEQEESRMKRQKKNSDVSNGKERKNSQRRTSNKKSCFKKKLKYESSSSNSDSDECVPLMDSDESIDVGYDDSECAECLESYSETKSKADWIQCTKCQRWLHETCSIYSYNGQCGDCGRAEIRKVRMMEKIKKPDKK